MEYFSAGIRSRLNKATGGSFTSTFWFRTLGTAISEASHCEMNSSVKSGNWSQRLTKSGLDGVKGLFSCPQKCSTFTLKDIQGFRNWGWHDSRRRLFPRNVEPIGALSGFTRMPANDRICPRKLISLTSRSRLSGFKVKPASYGLEKTSLRCLTWSRVLD
jgi:hypothetical protein